MNKVNLYIADCLKLDLKIFSTEQEIKDSFRLL